MPWGLKRYQQARDLHFVTCSCYRRQPLLGSTHAKLLFERALEQARRQYGFFVTGYVVMPEHVHLLVSEPERGTLARALQALKQSVARRLIGGRTHFWQARYYDFNVWTKKKRIEKLKYMHRNPVKRRLVDKPEDYELSLRAPRFWARGICFSVTGQTADPSPAKRARDDNSMS
jgi:putative transposase